ncbi:MAG: ABC transporter substrate-binding protein [Burkholderiales bacterium]|nr:ABC transporter substrate-binding protein [Burkholderiales bacterium]
MSRLHATTGMPAWTRWLGRLCLGAAIASTSAICAQAPPPIVIGQTIATSGGLAEHGRGIVLGALAHFEAVNRDGGVGGRHIELRTLDDAGDSAKATANARTLATAPEVLALFSGAEGGPCVATIQVATDLRIPQIGCAAGSPELRDPAQRYVFPVRAAHLSEFERLISTALQLGERRIGFLHAPNATGEKHLANVRKLLAARGEQLALALPLDGKTSASDLAKKIFDARVDVVFNHGSYSTIAEIFKADRKLDRQTRFMAVNSGAQQMVRLLGDDARGLVFTQVVPFPWGRAPAIVRDYRIALEKVAPKAEPSFSSLEGYINARVLTLALQRAGPRVTRESLVAAMESLHNIDLGGLSLSYGPGDRTGLTYVDTVIVKANGQFVH